MSDIEKHGALTPDDLDGEYYLASLIKASLERELLSTAEYNKIRNSVNTEISRVIIRASHGKSSSVRSEVAMTIAESVAFTVSIALKKESTPESALTRLKSDNILNIFLDGTKIIATKLSYIKHVYSLIKKEIISVDNETYNGFLPAIAEFIREYNPDYTAHFTHITADYPTAIAIEKLAGVEFIAKYVDAFYYENKCLSYLGKERIKELLSEKAGRNTSVFNIFSTVLKITLLRLISDMPLTGAQLSDSDKEDLISLITVESLCSAKNELQNLLKIKEDGAKKYADFYFDNYIIPDFERNGSKAFIFSTFG
ncbi:MAG: hypothetical protein IJC50_07470 [Clostridia bacterium]|nr:hypothetical protein [Clostridia bacterium]